MEKSKKIVFGSKSKETIERKRHWITFYRRNLEIFAEKYLGIKLHLYQKIAIHMMGDARVLNWVASRASAKSFIIAIVACCIAILYPGSKIVICSKTISMAGIIVEEKIQKELMNASQNLRREIAKVTSNKQGYTVDFRNGSYINVVVASDNGRGHRSTFLILEEYRMLDKSVIDSVLLQFAISRQAPYMMLPKYAHLKPEQSKTVYISSSYWKSHWMWAQITSNITQMMNGQDVVVLANDLFTTLEHHIKTYQDIFGSKDTMDELSFRMEFYNEMVGDGSNSYYKLKDFENCRTIKIPFVPLSDIELANKKHKDNQSYKNRQDGEIRILEVDIAIKPGEANDNSSYSLTIAEPVEEVGYIRKTVYIETHNGMLAWKQALRIKKLYYEFQCDYLVIDTKGNGYSVYEDLTKSQIDEVNGERFPAWRIVDNEEWCLAGKEGLSGLKKMEINSDAVPVIVPVIGSLKLNNDIAVDFKKQLENNKMMLLCDEQKAEIDLMQNDKNYRNGDSDFRLERILPFKQSSELINECINLVATIISGNIKVSEPSNGRKDRFMGKAYGNYFISILEREYLNNGKSSYSADEFFTSFNFKNNKNMMKKYFQ